MLPLRLGLGPVFRYEWLASTRRWRGYALRSAFAALLLGALLVCVSQSSVPSSGMTIRQLAALGETFFIALIGTQLTLVLLAAPAATAGAICQDRASGMMTHVLVTDLTDPEIVLGKLVARLVPVLGLVACALPILAIMTLLGGVDPLALVGAFVVSLGLAVLGCALGFGFSLWSKKTHEALLGTYTVYALWLLTRPGLILLKQGYGVALDLPPLMTDPYRLAFAPYWNPSSVGVSDYLGFLGLTLSLAAVLTLVAVVRLRVVCTRSEAPRPVKQRWWFQRRFRLPRLIPRPSLDLNPVLWREWHRSRPTRLMEIVVGAYAVGSVLASIGAVLAPPMSFAMAWVNGFQVSVGMLLLCVLAASSLAEERVRGSLDVLLTTTLSTPEIVIGKWLGTFRLVPLLAVGPVAVVLAGDSSKGIYLPTVVLTGVFVFVCGAMITGLGLLLATWSARPGRAVVTSVIIYVFLTVVTIMVPMTLSRGPAIEGLMMLSPFFFPGELAADLCGSGNQSHIGAAIGWTVVYLIAAVLFLMTTFLTFDRRLGRMRGRSVRPLPSVSRKIQTFEPTPYQPMA